MNIIEAWKQAKVGQKIKRKSWFDWEIVKERKVLTLKVKLRNHYLGGYVIYHTEYDKNGKEINPNRWSFEPIATGFVTFELEE